MQSRVSNLHLQAPPTPTTPQQSSESSLTCDSIGLVQPRSLHLQISRATLKRKVAETLENCELLEAFAQGRKPFSQVNRGEKEETLSKCLGRRLEKGWKDEEFPTDDSVIHELAQILETSPRTKTQKQLIPCLKSPATRKTTQYDTKHFLFTPRGLVKNSSLRSTAVKALSTQVSPREPHFSLPLISPRSHYQRRLFTDLAPSSRKLFY